MTEQARRVLYGLATGDALGAPFEFLSPEEISEIEMSGGENGLGQRFRAGEWTDDTEMTLRLAENLEVPLPLDRIARSYIEWADSGPPDIGTTTRAALQGSSGFSESRWRAKNFYLAGAPAAGNGTIMRAAPLAFLPLSDADLWPVVLAEAQITHYAPEAAEASWALALAVRQLLRGEDPNIPKEHLSLKTKEAIDAPTAWIVSEVSRGGSAWSSLAVALWSLQFDSLEEGLRRVVRLGADTDTNAACAGALLAARGERIPERWLSSLEGKSRIDKAAKRLAGLSETLLNS